MELTNGEVFGAREPLQQLGELKIPVKASLQVAKLAVKIEDECRAIDKAKNSLIKKYGKEDGKKGFAVEQGGENWDKFVDEFNELMSQTVTLGFEKILLPDKVASTCDKCNHNMVKALEIEPKILKALLKFVEVG